jgi:hypothetical protein
MAILREWRAEIRRPLKQEYVDYVSSTGLVAYRSAPGNLGACIAVRDLDDERAEIVTLSWWKDDDRFLLTRPETVRHYESTEISR